MKDNLFAKKTVESLIAETEEKDHKLRKVLGPLDLTFLGIGAVSGAVLVTTTELARKAGASDHATASATKGPPAAVTSEERAAPRSHGVQGGARRSEAGRSLATRREP